MLGRLVVWFFSPQGLQFAAPLLCRVVIFLTFALGVAPIGSVAFKASTPVPLGTDFTRLGWDKALPTMWLLSFIHHHYQNFFECHKSDQTKYNISYGVPWDLHNMRIIYSFVTPDINHDVSLRSDTDTHHIIYHVTGMRALGHVTQTAKTVLADWTRWNDLDLDVLHLLKLYVSRWNWTNQHHPLKPYWPTSPVKTGLSDPPLPSPQKRKKERQKKGEQIKQEEE